jgi:hypothetical protein
LAQAPVEVYDNDNRKVPAKMLVDAGGRTVRDPITGMPLIVDQDFDMDRAIAFGRLLATISIGDNPAAERAGIYAAMYSGQERRSDEPGFYEIGRWQCSDGNPVDAITVALITSDGGTLSRQIKLPGEIRGRIIGTDYGGYLQASLYDAGYRFCSEIDRAVARCAWRGEHPRRLCYLLFRVGTTSE